MASLSPLMREAAVAGVAMGLLLRTVRDDDETH
jgi:hypothetical protein